MNLSYKKLNNLVGWAVFIIAAITYLLTIEPNFSFWDCGEYIASAVKLEVTHSPGAVFFQILGAVWALFAMGAGDKYSLVINAMSAVMSAFAILFLFWTITHLTRKVLFLKTEPEELSTYQKIMILLSGAVGALTFTFTDTFWFSAVEGEVYAAASCFTALLLWLICKWENEADSPRANRWLVLISLIIGMSVGVHLMVILAVPALGYIYYTKKYDFTWKNFIIANLVIGGVFLFVFKIIFPFTMAFFGKSEIFFVNNLQMPFNTGSIFAFIAIILIFYFLLRYTIKKGYVLANTIVLSVLFMLIGFSSWVVLPIRANANTPINLNDPDNAIGMLDYYNRAQYGDWPVFYGANYTAYLDSKGTIGNEDNGPVYEKDEKSGRYIETGRRTAYKFNPEQVSILPRMYSPDTNAMENYGLMEGYPDFEASPDYVDAEAEKHITQYIYQNKLMNLPQEQLQGIYSQLYENIKPQVEKEQSMVLDSLRTLKKQGNIRISDYQKFADMMKIKKPAFGQNLDFMMTYQMGYMFIRYFLWNFVGRQNDVQGNYENTKGNWISGIKIIDNARLGDQDKLPDAYKNKANNKYYFLPLILGLVGFFFQLNRDPGRNFALISLFLLASTGIILYTSIKAFEPRERDYALVTSFYVFAVWIGMGVSAIMYGLSKLKKEKAGIIVGFITLTVPVLVGFQNWDDHDRSRRYTAYDFAKSYLQDLDKNNPILFVYGDNDTYPLWSLQETEEFRSDAKVVNYTLLGTSWYIDQVLRKTYEAPALPTSLTHEDYREGVNDVVVFFDKLSWGNMLSSLGDQAASEKYGKLSDSISAKEAIDFLKDQNIQNLIRDKRGYNKNIGFLPTNKIYIPVNKENALKYGIVRPEDAKLIVDNIVLTIKKDAIYKDGLAVLNMYSKYNWDRSIYFSSGGTYSPANLFFAQNYLEYQGLISKLVPIYTPEDEEGNQGRINLSNIYKVIMNYKFGNLKDPKAYFDETCRSNIVNYRMSSGRAATALARAGEKIKAEDILDLVNKEIPLNMYPATPSFNTIIGAYMYVGKEKEGEVMVDTYKKQIMDELKYYLSLPIEDQKFASGDISKLFGSYTYVIGGVIDSYLNIGQFDKAISYIDKSVADDSVIDLYQIAPALTKVISAYIYSGEEEKGLKLAAKYQKNATIQLNQYLAMPEQEQGKFMTKMEDLSDFNYMITKGIVQAYLRANKREKAAEYLKSNFSPLDERLERLKKQSNANLQSPSAQNLMYTYSQLLQLLQPLDTVYENKKLKELSEVISSIK